MFIGHMAVAFLGKSVAPETNLGTLLFGAVSADLLWSAFLITGVEHARVQPGITAANALDLYDIAISHGLAVDIALAGVVALAYYLARRYARGAWILFAAVVSHWLLDFISHRPDMPLAPGVHRYFGLGLWNSIPATVLVEGGLWAGAIAIYVVKTTARRGPPAYVFWAVVALLTLMWFASLGAVPPANPARVGYANLVFYSLLLAWAVWIDRARGRPQPRTEAAAAA